jgi:hypothetical protein
MVILQALLLLVSLPGVLRVLPVSLGGLELGWL